MSDEVTQFFEEVERLTQRPKASTEWEYRIHYDTVTGVITQCTMCEHPDSSSYIVVDRDTYDNYFRYHRVHEGRLIPLDIKSHYRVQLVKNVPYLSGQYRVVKNHSSLILEPGEDASEIDVYDRRPIA